MLLSHCPNCQHNNPPGERFCAACGVPLDLKPCPVCGKVDNVKATVCAGCGAHFPALPSTAAADMGAAHPSAPAKPLPPVITPPPTSMRALPLIIVALAAGGIPLLWLYRNTMPVPKAWQAPTPVMEAPMPAPTPIPAARPEPVPPVPQVIPPTASTPATIPLPPRAAPAPAVQPPPPPAAAKVAPPKPAAVAAKPAASTRHHAGQVAKPTPGTTAAGECTEALAAVGLCDPKAGK
jgi:hypothetical protein